MLARAGARLRNGHPPSHMENAGIDACTARMRAPCARSDTSGHLDRCLYSFRGPWHCHHHLFLVRHSSTEVPMSDQELIRLVKSFLAKRRAGASPGECFAWEEFYVRFDVVIRDSIATIHKAQDVIDDVAQDAWITLIKKLPRWAFNPAIGSIDAWLRKIARRLAAKCRSPRFEATSGIAERDPGRCARRSGTGPRHRD